MEHCCKVVLSQTAFSTPRLTYSLVLMSLATLSAMPAMMFTHLKDSLGYFFSLQACFEAAGEAVLTSASITAERRARCTSELD